MDRTLPTKVEDVVGNPAFVRIPPVLPTARAKYIAKCVAGFDFLDDCDWFFLIVNKARRISHRYVNVGAVPEANHLRKLFASHVKHMEMAHGTLPSCD